MEIVNPKDRTLKLKIEDGTFDENLLTFKIFLDKNFSFKNAEGEAKNSKSLEQFIARLFHQGYQPTMLKTFPVKDGKNEGWSKSKLGDNRIYWIHSNSEINIKNPLKENEILLYRLETKEDSDRANTRGRVSSNKIYKPSERSQWIELDHEKYVEGITFKNQLTFAKNKKNAFINIQGPAGSGKTTALAKRVTANKSRKTLWLTFNELLKNEVINLFQDKVKEKNLIVKDFVEFYNDLSDKELSISLDPFNAISSFKNVVLEKYYGDGTKDKNPKEWFGKEEFIYSEIHGKIIGRVGPLDIEGFPLDINSKFFIPGFDIKKSQYNLEKILQHKNLEDVDELSKSIFKKMVEKLEFKNIKELFPGPTNAMLLLESYEKKLPNIFENIQEILIDESQDLTYIELLLVCNFRSRLQNQLKQKVFFVTAGDERQSVRPTFFTKDMMSEISYGFEDKNNNLSDHIVLNGNKRSPKTVVNLINNLDNKRSLYPTTQKIRSQDFNYNEVDEDKNSEVTFYQVETQNKFKEIIEKFDLDQEFQLIYPSFFVDDLYFTKTYSKNASNKILPTGIVKGKEYSFVGIINASEVIKQLNNLKKINKPTSNVLAQLQINSFYVALSRSKDKVIFIEEQQNSNSYELINNFFNLDKNEENKVEINNINFETLKIYFDEEDLLDQKFKSFISDCKNYIDTDQVQLAQARFESIEEIIIELENTSDDNELFSEDYKKIGYTLFLKILIKKLSDKNIRKNIKETTEYKKLLDFVDDERVVDAILNFNILRHEPTADELEKCVGLNIEIQRENLEIIKMFDKKHGSEYTSRFYEDCINSLQIFYERLNPSKLSLTLFNKVFIKETIERIKYARKLLDEYKLFEASGLESTKDEFDFKHESYRGLIHESICTYGDFLFENEKWNEASQFYETLLPFESQQIYQNQLESRKNLNIYKKRLVCLENSNNKEKYDDIIAIYEMEIKDNTELIKDINTNPDLMIEVVNAARSNANFEFLKGVEKSFNFKGKLNNEIKDLVNLYNTSNSVKASLNEKEIKTINNILKNKK